MSPMASPHTFGSLRTSAVMGRVMLALSPATLFGFWQFGWPAIHLFWITLLGAALSELLCTRLMGKKNSLPDGSALLTGWLLALSLPPWAPAWLGFLGGAIAIGVGKQVFGGLGQNLFNPAMVARVVLLVSFPVAMTQWVAPLPLTDPTAPGFLEGLKMSLQPVPVPDAIASASLLGHAKTELGRGLPLSEVLSQLPQALWSDVGWRVGSMGETAAPLLLAGGLYLIAAGVIGWSLPAAVLAGLLVPAALAHGFAPERFLSPWIHLLSGSLMLGAFFIATDYVTSPNTRAGQVLFGLGIGFLTWLIRSFGAYPEGVAFAVLLMNALTPVIDRFVRPRILGRKRNGQALVPAPVVAPSKE